MNKFVMTMIAVGVIVVSGLLWLRNPSSPVVNTMPSPTANQQAEADVASPAVSDTSTAQTALDKSQFKDKSTTDKTIDAELKNIDSSVGSTMDSDFSASGLSTTELGM